MGTRERIRDAALKLFVAKGVAGTSVREIAQAARVAQGSLYSHYPSKEELAWELFSENFSAIGRELQSVQRRHDALRDKLAAMIGHVFSLFHRDWVTVSFVFFARHEQLRWVTGELGNPYLAFRGVIAEAMRRGEIPHQDPDVAASMVAGAIAQVVDTKILRRIRPNLTELTGTVTDAAMGILGAKNFHPIVNERSVTSTSTDRAGDTGEPRQSHPGGLDQC